MKKLLFACSLAATFLLASCHTAYEAVGFTRSRILIDSVYDTQPDASTTAFMQPYKDKVDSIMSPVVGTVAHYMAAKRPESDLSNLLADILVWGSEQLGDTATIGIYNMGGIRAALSKGPVTYGDVLNVAPFENKICMLTLTGEQLTQLFREIALVGGEGVSHAVRLVITKDGKLVSATVNGKPVDSKTRYRIATLDFLAQGNDHLDAFKLKTDVNSPQLLENNSRYVIMDYFKSQAKQGRSVSAKVEGRITIQ